MIDIHIQVENDNELISLWHRLNENEGNISKLAQEAGFLYKYSADHQGCWKAWDVVNDLVKSRNLEPLL